MLHHQAPHSNAQSAKLACAGGIWRGVLPEGLTGGISYAGEEGTHLAQLERHRCGAATPHRLIALFGDYANTEASLA